MRPMRSLRSQLSLAAVAAILGLLVIVQLRGQAGGSGLETKSAQVLTALVANQNTENDRLRAEVSNLQNQLAELRADRATFLANLSAAVCHADVGQAVIDWMWQMFMQASPSADAALASLASLDHRSLLPTITVPAARMRAMPASMLLR